MKNTVRPPIKMPECVFYLKNCGSACYLIKTLKGYILIDTGFPNKRDQIEKELLAKGCRPGDLKLIILTHGDPDHAGNALYLHRRYGAPVALHKADLEMVEKGRLLANRRGNPFIHLFAALFALTPLDMHRRDFFTPELNLEEGQDLSDFGYPAQIIHLPGHTAGSIGVLSRQGDLFSGDFLMNDKGRPVYSTFYADRGQVKAGFEKLKKFSIRNVYPGHGRPFSWDLLLQNPPC